MKCPRCDYSFSANRDVCPRCGLDVPEWAARRSREPKFPGRAAAHQRMHARTRQQKRRSLASEKRDCLKQDVTDLLEGLKEIDKQASLKIKNTSVAENTRSVVKNPNSYEAIKAEWDRIDEDATADRPVSGRAISGPIDVEYEELTSEHPDDSFLDEVELVEPLVQDAPRMTQRQVSYFDLRGQAKAAQKKRELEKSTDEPERLPQGKSIEELTQVIERVSDKKSSKARTKRQQAEFDKLARVFKTRNSDSSGQHPVVTPKN